MQSDTNRVKEKGNQQNRSTLNVWNICFFIQAAVNYFQYIYDTIAI